MTDTQAPNWEGFGRDAMKAWPEGDLDGFELQEIAIKHRVIVPVPGGFNPAKHEDQYGCADAGDDWFTLNTLKSTSDARIAEFKDEAWRAFWAIALRLAYCPEDLNDAQDGVVAAGLIADAFCQSIAPDELSEEPHPTFAEMIEKAAAQNTARMAELEAEVEKLRGAVKVSMVALDDWLNTYASEFCDDARVKEAQDRIMKTGGTLAYIADLQDLNRAALGGG